MKPKVPISAKPIRFKKTNKHVYMLLPKIFRKMGYPLRAFKGFREVTPTPLHTNEFPMYDFGKVPYLDRGKKPKSGDDTDGDDGSDSNESMASISSLEEGESKSSMKRASSSLAYIRASLAKNSAPSVQGSSLIVRRTGQSSVVSLEEKREEHYEGYVETPCVDCKLESDSDRSDEAPAMFGVRDDPPPKDPPILRKFKVILKETDTIPLLFIPSNSAERDSEEGKAILKQTEELKNSKLLIRMFEETAMQTPTREYEEVTLQIPLNKRKNQGAIASPAIIYDAYKEYELLHQPKKESFEAGTANFNREAESSDDEVEDCFLPEIRKILESPGFQRTCLIIERMINSKESEGAQLCYNGRLQLDPLASEAHFKHMPVFLWEFHNTYNKHLAVTSMSWNPVRPKVVAVSYGVFFKNSWTKKGKICIWNIKNTASPERVYKFETAVNFVEFSQEHPGLLCAAMYKGYICILDVTSKLKKVMFTTKGNKFSEYKPIWQARWFFIESHTSVPVCCTQNGKIFKFRKDATFKESTMLQLGWKVGNVKGIQQKEPPLKIGLTLPKRPGVFCIEPHPTLDTIYLAGTEDGCIHTCSIHYFNHHLDVFGAHYGPVFQIKFHPHSDKIYLSSGGDFTIRVWAFGESTPLIEFSQIRHFIEHAVWSPVHPSIIASALGTQLDIWDIRRIQPEPASSVQVPNGKRVTHLTFSPNGMNVLIGDVKGTISVFALENMPFVPDDKERGLAEALKRHKDGDKKIMAMLNSLGPPFRYENELISH